MACYHPIPAYTVEGGGISFTQLRRDNPTGSISIPCGRCIGCRLDRAHQWQTRMIHEALLHEENCFLTLTYDEQHLPPNGSLEPNHLRLFHKRLRRAYTDKPYRYYACGEYGELLSRPHYHLCLFGINFEDRKIFRKSKTGSDQFTSQILQIAWPKGQATISDFSPKLALYVAKYLMVKKLGTAVGNHYKRLDPITGEIYDLVPEFNRMSRRPALGRDYIRLYYQDLLASGKVVINGRETKPPRYYDKVLKNLQGFEAIQYQRYLDGLKTVKDTTPERLAVREKVAYAGLKTKKRHQENQL